MGGLSQLRDGCDDAHQSLLRGMDCGCFWVDLGESCEAMMDPRLWEDLEETFKKAKYEEHWASHRFAAPRHKYLEAFMHSAFTSGIHHFERPHFQTITGIWGRAPKHAPQCCEDILDSVKEVNAAMAATAKEVLGHMAASLKIELTYLQTTREEPVVTLHRVEPGNQKQVAAQEHFDFNTCNVIHYNYAQGFKVYDGTTWHQIAEPLKKTMVLFNLGSVCSMRTNRRITALFHRVDTPPSNKPPRMSIVCPIAPEVSESVVPHPMLVPEGEKAAFKPHTYKDHIFYAGKTYTTLNEHVKFNGKFSGVTFNKTDTVFAAAKAKIQYYLPMFIQCLPISSRFSSGVGVYVTRFSCAG